MSKITDAEDNATSLDGLVNDNGLITTLRNGPKPSWQYLVDGWDGQIASKITELNKSRGFRVIGAFADGFTYELFNDVGIDTDGNSWIYVGDGAPNKVVAAGTVPSVGAGYEQVTFNDHNSLANRDAAGAHNAESINNSDGGSVQDFIDTSKAQGIMPWDADTTYPINGLAKDSNGNVYVAVQEQSGNDPVSDGGDNWFLFLSSDRKIFGKRIVATADDDSGTPDAAITVRRTHTRPNSGHGFKEDTTFNPTINDVAYAAYDASFSTPSTNSAEIDHMVSYQSRLTHFSLGDLKYYSAVWALDRIEQGATCSNMFQFYDQGRTEGSTINHFSFVGNPLVNGSVQNYAGLRVNQPIGNPGGEIQNTLVGVYIEDLSFAGGAATYPIFIETQTNEASIGCYWRFKNRVIFEGSTIFKTSPTPDFDATRDLGASNFRWKQFHCITNNTKLLNLEPQNSEPTRISGSTVAMSDGTPSTNGFGTSGEGIYRCASDGQWVFVG